MVDAIIPQERRDFYVYVIFRPNGVPCYVGKGKGRRWKRHALQPCNIHLKHIYANAGGALPTVKVGEKMTEDEAFAVEIAFIAAIGREERGGPLVNKTDGGEGPSGWVPSAEWREHRRKCATQAWQELGMAERLAEINRGKKYPGRPHTDESKRRISESLKGNTHTLGYKRSEESKIKQSASTKGKPKTPQHAANISAGLRGKKHSGVDPRTGTKYSADRVARSAQARRESMATRALERRLPLFDAAD
jgi:NUMOD3 motif